MGRMRKSTKAVLIALAILILPAIYAGYLLYWESKIVDLVSVEVTDNMGQKPSGINVGLFPQWDKKHLPLFSEFTKNGVAEFHNIPPGKYKIVLYQKTECYSFEIKIEGMRVKIQMPLDECSITIVTTPK